eukprot:1438217-Prymnesium_polylepis.1
MCAQPASGRPRRAFRIAPHHTPTRTHTPLSPPARPLGATRARAKERRGSPSHRASPVPALVVLLRRAARSVGGRRARSVRRAPAIVLVVIAPAIIAPAIAIGGGGRVSCGCEA